MRPKLDMAAVQLDAMSAYLAFVPRDWSLPLSAQIQRDAAAGDVWARRVMHSRLLESPQGAETNASCEDLADVPLLSIAVAAQPDKARKQVQNAGHGVAGVRARRRRRSVGTPARRAVHAPLPSPPGLAAGLTPKVP
jgi:hypothetical protein